MGRVRVQCPTCHCIKKVYKEANKEDFSCQTCGKDFNATQAPVYKEIMIKDVKKDDVLHIEYSSGCFFCGYNTMLASPSPNGGISIQTKWTVGGLGLSSPVVLMSPTWGKMLSSLFGEAHFNSWKQDGYQGTYLDATEWEIILTLSNQRFASCYGIMEGHPPEWEKLNRFYELVMKDAGAVFFDEEKRRKIIESRLSRA